MARHCFRSDRPGGALWRCWGGGWLGCLIVVVLAPNCSPARLVPSRAALPQPVAIQCRCGSWAAAGPQTGIASQTGRKTDRQTAEFVNNSAPQKCSRLSGCSGTWQAVVGASVITQRCAAAAGGVHGGSKREQVSGIHSN